MKVEEEVLEWVLNAVEDYRINENKWLKSDRDEAKKIASAIRLLEAWEEYQRDAINFGEWQELYDQCWKAISGDEKPEGEK